MTTGIDSLSIEEITEIGQAAKSVFESGVLTPHEKTHLWEVMMRISARVKELGQVNE